MLHQNVNQDVFVSIVTSKLLQDVLLQLEIQKGSTAKWPIKGLCKRLLGYVNAKERSERNHVPTESSRVTRHDANKGRLEFKLRQNQGFVSRNGKGARSVEALTANVNSRTERSYLTSVNIVKDVIGVMNVQNIRLRNARIVLEEVVISV